MLDHDLHIDLQLWAHPRQVARCGFDSDAKRIANEASPRLGNVVYAYGALRVLVSW